MKKDVWNDKAYCCNLLLPLSVASSRRSVSQGAAQKQVQEKIKKARREETFFIFSRTVFCAALCFTN